MTLEHSAATNANKRQSQRWIKTLMSVFHANKGEHMATIKKAVEDAILELIDEGKLVIKGPDGEEMEDLSIEMKMVEDDDYSDDSDDDSEEFEDDDDDREEEE